MAFIEEWAEWPHLRGGLYEGFHCSVSLHGSFLIVFVVFLMA